MAPTLVNVAFGLLVGAALLGAAYDRRAVVVVGLAAALPDADAIASLWIFGATNALLHNLWIPAIATIAIYWDAKLRERSWLRDRWGWYGVRLAWVSVAVYAVAGIGADLFGEGGANLLYPLVDAFYLVDGWFLYSTQDGVFQTYVSLTERPVLDVVGTTDDYHVESWVNPTAGTEGGSDTERRLRIVDAGWQLVVIAAAVATTAVKLFEER